MWMQQLVLIDEVSSPEKKKIIPRSEILIQQLVLHIHKTCRLTHTEIRVDEKTCFFFFFFWGGGGFLDSVECILTWFEMNYENCGVNVQESMYWIKNHFLIKIMCEIFTVSPLHVFDYLINHKKPFFLSAPSFLVPKYILRPIDLNFGTDVEQVTNK